MGITLALLSLALLIAVSVSLRKRKSGWGSPGAGAMGTVYDMLNEDRRKAIEIIVEQRAEERDPETADDLPDRLGKAGGPGT